MHTQPECRTECFRATIFLKPPWAAIGNDAPCPSRPRTRLAPRLSGTSVALPAPDYSLHRHSRNVMQARLFAPVAALAALLALSCGKKASLHDVPRMAME